MSGASLQGDDLKILDGATLPSSMAAEGGDHCLYESGGF